MSRSDECCWCGMAGHNSKDCKQPRNIGTAAKFARSSNGDLIEVRPGFTPGLRILAKSAPWLGLGEIAPSSGARATGVNGGIGDE